MVFSGKCINAYIHIPWFGRNALISNAKNSLEQMAALNTVRPLNTITLGNASAVLESVLRIFSTVDETTSSLVTISTIQVIFSIVATEYPPQYYWYPSAVLIASSLRNTAEHFAR